MNTKPFTILPDKVVIKSQLRKYGEIVRFVCRQTCCSIITMTHLHQIKLQWAGSPRALFVVYVLQQHSVVPGTTAAAAVVASYEKDRSYV